MAKHGVAPHCTLDFSFFYFVSPVLPGRLGEVEGEGAEKPAREEDGCLGDGGRPTHERGNNTLTSWKI